MKHAFLCLVLIAPWHLAVGQQVIDSTIDHDGLTRTYRLYVPAGVNTTDPVPLVFNLHGYTSNNVQQDLYSNLRPVADTAKFLILMPNGTTDGNGDQFWNCFGTSTVDDVGFLSALLDHIGTQYNVDPTRVYSCGMSNGGFMSYELACQLGGRIAAIASVTGTMTTDHLTACNAVHPTPVMQIHGTADPTVPYLGSVGLTPIEDIVQHWVSYNNCNAVADVLPVPDISTTDNCTAEHFLYADGDLGSTVEFFKVTGGEHTWPGAIIDIGVTSHDFTANTEIWRFFSQYRLDVLYPEMRVSEASAQSLHLYPNPASSEVKISVQGSNPSTTLRVTGVSMSDALGRTLMSLPVAEVGRVDISQLPAGIYTVNATLNNGSTVHQRLVVERSGR